MDKKEIGLTVKQIREHAAFSQEQLAEKAGVSCGTISMIERGARAQP